MSSDAGPRVAMAAQWLSAGITPPPPLSSSTTPLLGALSMVGAAGDRMTELKLQVELAAAVKDRQRAPQEWDSVWPRDWHKHELAKNTFETDCLLYSIGKARGEELRQPEAQPRIHAMRMLAQGLLPMPKAVHERWASAQAAHVAHAKAEVEARRAALALQPLVPAHPTASCAAAPLPAAFAQESVSPSITSAVKPVVGQEGPNLEVFTPITSTAQEPPARDEQTPLPDDTNRKRKLDLDDFGPPPCTPQPVRPMAQPVSPARRGLQLPSL